MSQIAQVHDGHRQRLAYVYVRQSTLRQVAEHQESQDLQYQLVARAQALGWSQTRIVVIDEDLGKSAVRSSGRSGFQRLFTDVGTGKVVILLVTDVSRLARNCADWYQLLDLTAYNQVLVADSGALYNPCAYDDRLLLGVKGAFSEAQWYIMRQQMQAARLNKARRGELALCLPVGYERLPEGTVVMSPDQQVQDAVRLVFRLFAQAGSARETLRQLQASGIQLPRQQRTALGQTAIIWGPPRYQQVYQMLKLPAYAGVYAYGQRQREALPGKQRVSYGRRLPPQEWLVLLPDALPAYTSWEDYLSNQETLAANWQATPFAAAEVGQGQTGRAGCGRALLQGLVFCAHCGRQMRVRYRDKPAYVCEAGKMQNNEPRCNYLPYAHVDQAMVAAFLEAVQPAALESALTAVEELAAQRAALQRQWQQLQRAGYQTALARARYEQVDPHLRLVAAALEQAWEAALVAEQQLQQEWQEVQASTLQSLSVAEEALVRQLAHDLPALWSAETTTIPDRKRLLRTLIAAVTLDSKREAGVTHLQLRWQSGAVTQLVAARPRPGYPSDPALLARVRALTEARYDDEQMAAALNQEGLVSSWHVRDDAAYVPGQPVTYWTAARVRHLRYKHKLAANPAAAGLCSAQTAAQTLGVSISVLLDWFRRGFLPGQQQRRGAPIWIRLDEAVRHRLSGAAPLRLPASQPPLIPLAQAAAHFGLTPTALTAALQAERLLAWRLEHGCQYRWYVQQPDSLSAEPADLLSK